MRKHGHSTEGESWDNGEMREKIVFFSRSVGAEFFPPPRRRERETHVFFPSTKKFETVEEMDTYYNPIPHFTYEMALAHSPELRGLPVLPRGGEDDGADDGVAGL